MPSPRSVELYADFLRPHLGPDKHLVDVGCGSGELSLELAGYVGRLTGIDIDAVEVDVAREVGSRRGLSNAVFRQGDAYDLELADGDADLVFAHSVLEALDRPGDALVEMRRILKPAGMVAVASVDYGGLLLAGPANDLVRRFYEIRVRLWRATGSDPYLGRQLRGLLHESGFNQVTAATRYISYGTEAAVREFGLGRAEECLDEWYASELQRLGLATARDLESMRRGWLEWAVSPSSYAAFAWCRALGWK